MAKLISAGVDTGYKNLGMGAVSFDTETLKMEAVHMDYVLTSSDSAIHERLLALSMATVQMANLVNPHVSCVERYFAHKIGRKGKSAIYDPNAQGMYMAMGVVMLALRHCKPVIAKPQYAKTAVTGNSKANKDEVDAGVRRILNIDYAIDNEHIADALALAIARIFETPVYKKSGCLLHLPLFA